MISKWIFVINNEIFALSLSDNRVTFHTGSGMVARWHVGEHFTVLVYNFLVRDCLILTLKCNGHNVIYALIRFFLLKKRHAPVCWFLSSLLINIFVKEEIFFLVFFSALNQVLGWLLADAYGSPWLLTQLITGRLDISLPSQCVIHLMLSWNGWTGNLKKTSMNQRFYDNPWCFNFNKKYATDWLAISFLFWRWKMKSSNCISDQLSSPYLSVDWKRLNNLQSKLAEHIGPNKWVNCIGLRKIIPKNSSYCWQAMTEWTQHHIWVLFTLISVYRTPGYDLYFVGIVRIHFLIWLVPV